MNYKKKKVRSNAPHFLQWGFTRPMLWHGYPGASLSPLKWRQIAPLNNPNPRIGKYFILSYTGTRFQKRVWEKIKKIPYGQTRTYKEIAKAIRNPFAYRAVGQACKRNPFPILIPCHRVIKSNGSFGGYSGGIKKKKLLLELEKGRSE